ncbi:hypothetical protein GCM10009765_50350 [Fodinicola feengrottensis]|uniref:Intracellular septation protein A n=1 Tax=Fodinicola feengrottensis TaxID=435914 RepID=A0ABN2HXW6_9ACTN
MTEPVAQTATGSAAKSARKAMVISLFLDMGLSIVAYYGLRMLGADQYVALLAGTVVAGLRIVYVALKARRLDGFAVFMMGTFGVSLGLSFLTGDARFLLLKDSIGTSVVGAIFLISTVIGKPVIFHAARRFTSATPEKAQQWEQRWQTEPAVRHTFRVLSTVWGCGLLLEAAIRIPLVYLLPIDVMAGLAQVFGLFFIGPLIVWMMWYVKRRTGSFKVSNAHQVAAVV